MYSKFADLLSKKNVTTYQVSKATGISQGTFSSWKHGRFTPKVDKLLKIANYFKVPLDYFLENK